MIGQQDGRHVADVLPAYAQGTLAPADATRVRRHLDRCPLCRAEAVEWEAIKGATRMAAYAPAPSPALLDGVWEQIDQQERATPALARQRWAPWQVLLGQLPLVHRRIWIASALTMALGWVVALPLGTSAGAVVALLTPLVAAIGVAFIYGPENDPALEIALSTPTSPRLVLLARLTLVFGYDLALAGGATVLLALLKGVTLWPLIALWLGPMLCLSALSLLLALIVGATAAVLLALVVWGLHVTIGLGAGNGLLHGDAFSALNLLWGTNLPALLLATLFVTAAFVYAPRREPSLALN